MADQGNRTSSSSEYSDERAARPAPGTDEYFNEKIYCTCKRCQNRKLKKRRLVRIHRLKYGVYIEETLPVHNIAEERMDAIDDSHSRDEVQDTFMSAVSSDVPMGALNSTTGDPLILNGLIEMLRNGQGQNIIRMVHEAISKVVSTPITPFSTSNTTEIDPIMLSDTPSDTQKVFSRCVMPSTSRLHPPTTKVASSTMPHSMPCTSNRDTPSIPIETDMHAPTKVASSAMHHSMPRTSNRDAPSIPIETDMHAPTKVASSALPHSMLRTSNRDAPSIRIETDMHAPTKVASSAMPHSMLRTSNRDAPSIRIETDMHAPVMNISQSINNPSNRGSDTILPPTPEQATLRSLIESQSRTLKLLPDTPENAECRKEILKQIELWERTLLGSAELTSDEQVQEINEKVTHVPIGASISTPKTTTVSLVTTKGAEEVKILLSSEGDVLKDEMGMKFFHFIFHRAEQLFGNTIQLDWRKQASAKKEELFKDVITAFGNPGFNKESILDIARKYIHSKRDNLRSKLTKDLRYPRPAWITDQVTWDELMEDAKFKRKTHSNPNNRQFAREGSKRRLRDTTKATQARVSSIGSHKLGSGGYNSIRGDLVNQFQKEASEEDLKFALLHGSQGLRQHMLDRGEKLITCHEFEEAQQSTSSSSKNEKELEEHDELFVAHNDSTIILEPQQETILELQKVGNKNNEEDGVQCVDQTTPTIRIVPRRKRTQRRRMDRIDC